MDEPFNLRFLANNLIILTRITLHSKIDSNSESLNSKLRAFFVTLRMTLTENKRQYSLENLQHIIPEFVLEKHTVQKLVPEEYQTEYYREFSDPASKLATKSRNVSSRREICITKESNNLDGGSKSAGTSPFEESAKLDQAVDECKEAVKSVNNNAEHEEDIISCIEAHSNRPLEYSKEEKSIPDQKGKGKPPMAQYGTGNTRATVPALHMKTFNTNPPISEV